MRDDEIEDRLRGFRPRAPDAAARAAALAAARAALHAARQRSGSRPRITVFRLVAVAALLSVMLDAVVVRWAERVADGISSDRDAAAETEPLSSETWIALAIAQPSRLEESTP